MRWLCLYFPRLPLEALSPGNEGFVAVVQRRRYKRQLLACGTACAEHAITPGLDAATAQGRCPELKLLERSYRHEVQALWALCAWSTQFSAFVSPDPLRSALWLEIASVLRYFGGIHPLLEKVESGLRSLGYQAHLGVAPTQEAALVVAFAKAAPMALEGFQDRLAKLPIAALYIDPALKNSFTDLGLQSIGDLLEIPADALARRYGPQLTDYLARLTGQLPDALCAYQPPQRFRRVFECFGEIESFEGLLFPIKRILGELEGFLRARDSAVQRLHLAFGHERHPASGLDIRSTQPTRDASRLFMLVRERIERATLAAGVTSITVSARRLVPLSNAQASLFDGETIQDEAWPELLDRLRARLGETAVRSLGLRDDHRPEKAWCTVDCAAAADQNYTVNYQSPERPLWLLTPRRLDQLPALLGLPERIEAGWWDGEDVQRDYYLAHSPEGARWWLYRDLQSGDYYLQGLWA